MMAGHAWPSYFPTSVLGWQGAVTSCSVEYA